MRDFNQASLDEHLANLTQNLTPEQAQQVKERVREKASGGWFDMPPAAIDGAFDLVGAVLNGIVALPNIGNAGGKVGSVLSGLDPRQFGVLRGGDLLGQAGDAVSGLAGSAGNLLGSVPDLGSSALGSLAKLVGGAGDLAGNAGDAAGAVADLAGNAGAIVDVLGAVLDAAPDAGELAGAILEALGDVLSNS
jgi:hypothetical protein